MSCAKALFASMVPGQQQQQQQQQQQPEVDSRWALASCGVSRNGERHSVYVDNDLTNKLKPHQKEGVEFIWKNCFSDWEVHPSGTLDESKIG